MGKGVPMLSGGVRGPIRVAVVLALLVAVGDVTASRAQEPEKAAARVTPDLSTARSAALAWVDATWAGDAPAAHRVLLEDEGQRAFMAAPLRFNAALRALEAAAVERFGEAGRRVSGYPDGSAKAVGKDLEVTEEGDRATASHEASMLRLRLRRVGGEWRVDLGDTFRDPRAQRAAEASAAAAKVAEAVADEIRAGKFDTADAAKAAFRARRLAEVEK